MGQLTCAVIIMALGFLPGYVISLVMKKLNVLRIPKQAEIIGIDLTEIRDLLIRRNTFNSR